MPARLRRTLAVLLLLLPAAPAFAAVPSTLGYQGLLTDGGGSPVPTGAYDLTFALYDVSSGGTALWTEAHPGVGVNQGSFAVTLGSVNSLSSVAFDKPLWLGISIGAAPELAPRVELASSPYALGLRTPFAATTNGMTPTLRLTNQTEGAEALRVDGWLGIHHRGEELTTQGLIVYDELGEMAVSVGGASSTANPKGGYVFVASDLDQGTYAYIDGRQNGNPGMFMGGASGRYFAFYTGAGGDTAVHVPDGSIGPLEMWGLPGISHTEAALVTIGTTMGPILSTTISTPMPGYIRVTAGGEVRLSGTTGFNSVSYQIHTNPVAAEDGAVARVAGAHQFVSTAFHFHTANAERVYFLPAGTHTFYLQAKRDGAGSAGMANPSITATFYPGSYGSVVSTMETGETADLRQLELRALEARLEAERAMHALELARSREAIPNVKSAAAAAGSER